MYLGQLVNPIMTYGDRKTIPKNQNSYTSKVSKKGEYLFHDVISMMSEQVGVDRMQETITRPSAGSGEPRVTATKPEVFPKQSKNHCQQTTTRPGTEN